MTQVEDEEPDYEAEALEGALHYIYRTIDSETRDLGAEGVDVEALEHRICEAVTYEGLIEHRRLMAEAKAKVEAAALQDSRAVVRKRGNIAATWHHPAGPRRPWEAPRTTCGKAIPEDAETGFIGDDHVVRSFLCGACFRK